MLPVYSKDNEYGVMTSISTPHGDLSCKLKVEYEEKFDMTVGYICLGNSFRMVLRFFFCRAKSEYDAHCSQWVGVHGQTVGARSRFSELTKAPYTSLR